MTAQDAKMLQNQLWKIKIQFNEYLIEAKADFNIDEIVDLEKIIGYIDQSIAHLHNFQR